MDETGSVPAILNTDMTLTRHPVINMSVHRAAVKYFLLIKVCSMTCNRFRDFIRDEGIIGGLLDPGIKLILILGASDTGKTTLIEGMADFLSVRRKVGIVDLDIGQSHIGPPTTVAWGKVGKGFSGWGNIKVEDFYFIGAVSPVGNLLAMWSGSLLMTNRALTECEKVIVDTTGLIQEPAGRILKHCKIELLRPEMVVALERERELEAILDPSTTQKGFIIHRLHVPQQVVVKNPSERCLFRSAMFTHYFQNNRLVRVSLAKIRIQVMGDPHGFIHETDQSIRETIFLRNQTVECTIEPNRVIRNPAQFLSELRITSTELNGRIVSLRDEKNTDRALGIIEEFDEKEKKLLIRTPLDRAVAISTVVIGSITIAI